MSEREHDDGRCCENGYFGQQHNCQKQQSPMSEEPKPREWTLRVSSSEDGSAYVFSGDELDYHTDDYLEVVERSALTAAEAKIAELEREVVYRKKRFAELERSPSDFQIIEDLQEKLTDAHAICSRLAEALRAYYQTDAVARVAVQQYDAFLGGRKLDKDERRGE